MKFRRGLIAGSFIVAGGLLALGTVVLKEMQEARRTQALEASANVVATLEADIARNIELYALSLQAVVDNLAEPEVHTVSNKLRHLILFDRSATAKHLGNMHVLDEKGYELINSRTLEPRKESFAERDYFQAHRDNPDAGLYIGKPFATPTKGTYVIGISRRLSHLDGSFGGVVAGTLRLSFFQELFARVALEPGSSIGLFRMDGTMIIRSPFKAEDIGRNIGKGAEVFKRALAAPVGQFETVAALDGVNRFYSYRRVGNFPLFISLGNSTAAIYAAWPGEAAVLIAVVLALALATIALAVFASRELRRRASAEKQLRKLASTDSLTALSNRRTFDAALAREWSLAKERGAPLGLLMIDADNFKAYNDKEGHQAGDAALAAIACCISGNISETALAARYGGEEFAVLLPGAFLHEAFCVAESIRKSVADFLSPGSVAHPTVSVGITSQIPNDEYRTNEFVAAADSALYDAKRKGRNRTAAQQVAFVSSAARRVA